VFRRRRNGDPDVVDHARALHVKDRAPLADLDVLKAVVVAAAVVIAADAPAAEAVLDLAELH